MELNSTDILSQDKLREFGNQYVSTLIKLLVAAGKKGSGALIKSINWKLRTAATSIDLVINAESYLTYVDQGRRPGKYPPIQQIAKWCAIKGIPQEAAFPIARNIFKFGIKPTNVIQKTIATMNSSETVIKFEKDIANKIELIMKNKIETPV